MSEGSITVIAGEVPISTILHSICFHTWPEPLEGSTFTCSRCGDWVTEYKRPKREPKSWCYECGHTTKKGPKQKKRWMWVKAEAAE